LPANMPQGAGQDTSLGGLAAFASPPSFANGGNVGYGNVPGRS